MRTGAVVCTLGLIFAADACSDSSPPRTQWKVLLATDAPIPGLGQELALELIDDAGNAVSPEDTRLVDVSSPASWPVSFGILPTPGRPPPRIRARLYRLDQVGAGALPVGSALIDATATLPPAAGVTVVALPLRMSCFSVAPDPGHHLSCDSETGALAPEPVLAPTVNVATLPKVGSWPPAVTVPCTNPEAGMVCIPGGVFLMGSAQFAPSSAANDPSPEHLVQVSPFAVDADEMTVGQVRALVVSNGLAPPLTGDFQDYSSSTGPCTYLGPGDASHDAYPINCIDWQTARAACGLLGKRLPTEAEWEYIAGNLAEKTRFPWGSDPDICSHAIVARGRALSNTQESLSCELEGPNGVVAPGPVPGGDATDVTELGIRNLGGNMDEWVDDFYQPYGAPCWSGTLLVDPECMDGQGGQRSIRGGNWSLDPWLSMAFARDGSVPQTLITTGLRCVVSH